MDIPSKIWITCPAAELKQVPGTLIAISPHGFYEVNVAFGANTHKLLLPIGATALTTAEPILTPAPGFDLER
jgi:hypothetical protein